MSKPPTKTTKKATKRPATKKAGRKPSRPLKAVPDPDISEDAPKDKEGTEEAKEKQAPKLATERVKPIRPERPAIPKIATPKFSPDSSLLTPVAEAEADHLRIVLYGDQGVGKSTSLASLTKRGRVIIVDPENSIRRGALKRQGIDVDKILLWPDWSYDGIQQLYVTVKAELEEDPNSFYALGFDSGSTLSEAWLEESVRESIAKPAMKRKHPDRDSLEVFQEDYGTLVEKFRQVIIRMFYTLPLHVVLTAHSKRFDNELGAIMVGPNFTPAVQGSIMTHSDWIIRQTMTADGTKRKLEAAPKGSILAKDRFGVLDGEMWDASLMDLIEIWEEELS